jgi:O-antigen ligase
MVYTAGIHIRRDMIPLVVVLAFLTLGLAFTYEAGLVYVWVLLSSLYILLPQMSLAEGFQQGLYGAASIACLPAITIASLRNIGYSRKFLPFFICVIGVSAVVMIAGYIHKIPIIEQLRPVGGMLVFVFTCFLCYSNLNKDKSIKTILICLTMVSLLVAGYGLVDFLFLHKMAFIKGATKRAGSLFIGNANVLSNYCLFFFSVFLALFLEGKKFLYLGLSVFYLLCILITLSNSGIAGMLVSFCVVAFFYRLYRKPKHMLYIVLGILLLLVVLFGMEYISSPSLHHVTSGGTITARTETIWPVTLKLIEKSPMFGYTPNGASMLLDRLIDRTSTHNEFLGMLLNYGIVGSIFVLMFILLSFLKLNKMRLLSDAGILRGSSIGCLAYMCGAGVYGLAHSIGFASTITFPFWFFSMALIGLHERSIK